MWNWLMEKIYGEKYYYDKAYNVKRSGNEVNYIKEYWGHALHMMYTTKTPSGLRTPLIITFMGHGHVKKGDILTTKINGEIKRMLVFRIHYKMNTRDMFDAQALIVDDYEKIFCKLVS